MSLGASGLIKMIDFEVSSICNAGCSVCMRRRDGHYSEFVSTYWSVADVKRVLDLDIVKNLGTITMFSWLVEGTLARAMSFRRFSNSNSALYIYTLSLHFIFKANSNNK